MAYDNHLRLTLAGDIAAAAGSVERWSFRLNMSDPDSLTSGSDGYFDDLVADCKAYVTAEVNVWNGAGLDEVKLAFIGPPPAGSTSLGVYTKDARVANFPRVPFGGQGSVSLFPNQVALAISLGTGQRGRSKRGRIYLPMPQVSLESDGQFLAVQADGIRNRFVTFVNNLNNGPGFSNPEPRVTIASQSGANTDVTQVRVGRVLDTIRSRRRSLPEAYNAWTDVTA
jgi:hypothetical protein